MGKKAGGYNTDASGRVEEEKQTRYALCENITLKNEARGSVSSAKGL
jgi:hypothetical protein